MVFLSAVLYFAPPVPCEAQMSREEIENAINSELSNRDSDYLPKDGSALDVVLKIRNAMIRFLKVILLLSSLVSLVLASYNMMSGEPSGVKRMFLVAAGLAVGLVLLEVMGKVGYNAGGNELKDQVRAVLQVLLSIVSLVTLVGTAIQIMHGEKEGIPKLFKWLIVSVLGISFMNIV